MRDSEQALVDAAVLALRKSAGITASYEEPALAHDNGIDACMKMQTAGGTREFEVQVKAVDRFQTPAQVKAQLTPHAKHPLLVAPYITRETASRCRALHLSFLDTAGNAFLEAPGLYVYIIGEPRPKQAAESRYRAVGTAGLQITFALLARPELIRAPYRAIARESAVALGTITPVLRDLEARGFVRSEPNRALLDPLRLLEEWVTHYPITLRPKLDAKRFEGDRKRIQEADLKALDAFWGSEVAAERLTRHLRPAVFSIYTRRPYSRLVSALRLRAHPEGNVEVLHQFWRLDPDPLFPDLVPPVLAYADLMSSRDGRNAEAANLIYEQRLKPVFQTLRTAR